MQATPVIAIFDVGKTNKKLFLFDENYRMLYENCIQLSDTADEDGFPCEDVQALAEWVLHSFRRVTGLQDYDVRAVNFSAYGASFVHIDEKGTALTPLYNYLKPFPLQLQKNFYQTYGGEALLSRQTASPVLGSLNSGLQLYRIKHEQPAVFSKIRYSLHLPQYLCYLLSQKAATDVTSVGCHTLLWDFAKNSYHPWVEKEALTQKFAPLRSGEELVSSSGTGNGLPVGIGLHDSSAALIPYLALFHEPFVLISTGTWCISLNPFNEALLTNEELEQDCLCYLTYQGKPVKASRLFAGNEHEQQVKRLAAQYNKQVEYYKTVSLDLDLLNNDQRSPFIQQQQESRNGALQSDSLFAQRDLAAFASYEEAYHQLMQDIVAQQVVSTRLVLDGTVVKRIFVDGGFSKNAIYMHLLAIAFPEVEVYAASMAQATAMGAALAIHSSWNSKYLSKDIIGLQYYGVAQRV
jgi:sugar (pentulose or hexulose) kinase